LPDGESEIFLRMGLDMGFRKSGSDLPVEAGQEFAHLSNEDNFLLWLMLNWWQKFLRNSADKRRKNSTAFVEKRVLAQPRRANRDNDATLNLPGFPSAHAHHCARQSWEYARNGLRVRCPPLNSRIT
jgi:hypothetical protein